MLTKFEKQYYQYKTKDKIIFKGSLQGGTGMNKMGHDNTDVIDESLTTNNEIVIREITICNEDVCEKLLFCFDDEQTKSLVTKKLDDILFEDFKNKLNEEEYELDDKEDIKVEDKSQKVTLKQAVEDFTNGIDDAFNFIYVHYRPILERWGRRYNDDELGYELLDVVLLTAVKTYNNKAGTKFNTYFWACAQNYVHCNTIKKNAQKRAHNKDMISLQRKCMYKGDQSEVELESMIEDNKSTKNSHDNELRLSILSMDDCLKNNEIQILLKLLDNFTLQEIGNDLGVTAAAICMSLKRIAKKKIAAKRLREILTT